MQALVETSLQSEARERADVTPPATHPIVAKQAGSSESERRAITVTAAPIPFTTAFSTAADVHESSVLESSSTLPTLLSTVSSGVKATRTPITFASDPGKSIVTSATSTSVSPSSSPSSSPDSSSGMPPTTSTIHSSTSSSQPSTGTDSTITSTKLTAIIGGVLGGALLLVLLLGFFYLRSWRRVWSVRSGIRNGELRPSDAVGEMEYSINGYRGWGAGYGGPLSRSTTSKVPTRGAPTVISEHPAVDTMLLDEGFEGDDDKRSAAWLAVPTSNQSRAYNSRTDLRRNRTARY